MKLFNKIKWKFSDYPAKTDYHFFNGYVTAGTHFKGAGSFTLELWYEGGCVGFTNFKRWQVGSDFSDTIKDKGRLRSITIRLGKPIIHIHLTKASRDKSMEQLSRYAIK